MRTPDREPPDDAWTHEEDDLDGGLCHWCAGEGWAECDDPIQCTNDHSPDGLCRCSSCGGSGLAKDMTIW